ncbi:MAG: hypothetical protein HYY85_00515 [Deltaproteobacteria bacterium]|nr:hypothetical protein [Deltaproteobacteria bacterium]
MAILQDYRLAGLPEAELAMLGFAEKLTRTPSAMTRDDPERLRRAGFSEVEIFDIILATAYRNFISRVVQAAGVEAVTHLRDPDPELLRIMGSNRQRTP